MTLHEVLSYLTPFPSCFLHEHEACMKVFLIPCFPETKFSFTLEAMELKSWIF